MEIYKSQLWKCLMESGWEVVGVEPGFDWWADEHWRVQSQWNLWGHEIVLSFLVDPQWEPRMQGKGIYEISATEEIPVTRPIGNEAEIIASLSMMKGRFDEKLNAFILSINRYRDDLGSEQAKTRS